MTPIASVQNRYNFSNRDSEDVVDACATANIAFLPWGPLGQGSLTGSSAVETIAANHDAVSVRLPWPGSSSARRW